eukprot:393724-Pyramimonas_sp.AAC.1
MPAAWQKASGSRILSWLNPDARSDRGVPFLRSVSSGGRTARGLSRRAARVSWPDAPTPMARNSSRSS